MEAKKEHSASRYHDISCGHRVVGHENKCRHLHGHNYRVHFKCVADSLDAVGRVVDFGVIKEKLCMWIEDNWDHKFLAWANDPVINCLHDLLGMDDAHHDSMEAYTAFEGSVVFVPFNPTAENMAEHLVTVVGPIQLFGTGVRLVEVVIEETAKCSASYKEEV